MFSFEKKLSGFLEKNILLIFIIISLPVSFLLRLSAFNFISSDMDGFLIGWFGQIEQLGGIRALNTQVGNYSVLYQTLISIMTYIPVNPVWQYKFLSVIFDYSLAIGVAMIIKELTGNKVKSLAGMFIVLFSPLVFVNSAVWGQCDSIYTSFGIWAIYLFIKKKYPAAFILYGIACAFKLQAVFFLPFFLFAYVRKKDFSVLQFLIIPAVMEAVCIPAMVMGRGFKAAFSVFWYQTESCDKLYFNYPSLWALFSDLSDNSSSLDLIANLKIAAIALAFSVLLVLMTVLFVKKADLNAKNIILVSFLFIFTCVLFLPGMHERYGFAYEILAIVIAFMIPKTIPALLSLTILSCITYGNSLSVSTPVNPLMAAVNILCYAFYCFIIIKELLTTPVEVVNEGA